MFIGLVSVVIFKTSASAAMIDVAQSIISVNIRNVIIMPSHLEDKRNQPLIRRMDRVSHFENCPIFKIRQNFSVKPIHIIFLSDLRNLT